MKKYLKVLSFVLVIMLLTACSISSVNAIKEIDYSEFKEKIENKENFILEVMQTGCSHCEEFSPRLRDVLNDNDLEGFSINLSNLNDEDRKEFSSEYDVTGTPSVLFFDEGEELLVHRLVGTSSNDEVVKALEETKFIK